MTSTSTVRRLVVFGRQGAGKGTQCSRLASALGLVHVASGDIFRWMAKQDTPDGKEVRRIMDAGELVPDELAVAAVCARLAEPDAASSGYLLDGFPRRMSQARALAAAGADAELAIEIDVPAHVVQARMVGRRVCQDCGTTANVGSRGPDEVPCPACEGIAVRRSDDTPEAIRRRLAVYERDTAPVVAWYGAAGRLLRVDGTGEPDTVTARIMQGLGAGSPARPMSVA